MKFKRTISIIVMSLLVATFCLSTLFVRSASNKMVHIDVTDNARNLYFTQSMQLESNKTYKISAKYKFITGNLSNGSVYVSILNSNSSFVASSHVSCDHEKGFDTKVAMDGWNGIEFTFINDQPTANYKIGFYIDTASAVEFYFADFKVVDVENLDVNMITNNEFANGLLGWASAKDGSTSYTSTSSKGGTLTATLEDFNIDYFRVKQNTVYVSSSGDDENIGTREKPLKTFEGACGGLKKDGTIIVIDEISYLGNVTNHNTVKIIGEENAQLSFPSDVGLKGNLVLENIAVDNASAAIHTDGYVLQIGEGVSFNIDPEIYIGDSKGAQRVTLESGNYANVVISNSGVTKLSATNADVKNLTLSSNESGSVFKAELDSSNLSQIKYENSKEFKSAEIVNNNANICETDVDDGISYIASSSSENSKVSLTNDTGVYNVSTETGKLPIAVSKNGSRIYSAVNSPVDTSVAVNEISKEFSDYISYRTSLSNTYRKLTEDKELNVVYFGGSVTAGYGSTNNEKYSWRALVGDWFENNFPEAKINNINRSLGETGTYLGAYRVQRDVINQRPDIVFLEYAINDYYFFAGQPQSTPEEKLAIYKKAALQYETIVREIKEALPNCDIVTILTTEKGCASAGLKGELHLAAQAHEDMSVLYNIPTIKVGLALFNKLGANYSSVWDTYFIDSVHATDAGYAFYYSVIEEYLNNSLINTSYGANIHQDYVLPAVQSDYLFDGNRSLIQPTAQTVISSETLGGSGFSYAPDYYGVHDYYGYLSASTDGAELCLQFSGTELAILSNYESLGSTATFSVSVDGGDYYTVNCTGKNPTVLAKELSSATHTIKIKPNITANGQIKIGAILTIDNTQNTLKGSGGTIAPDGMQQCSLVLPCDVWQVSYYEKSVTLNNFAIPTKEGYTFIGWMDANGELLPTNHVLAYGEVINAKFVPLTETGITIDGDVNSDDEINSIDVSALRKVLLEVGDLPWFDVNGDGVCNIKDLVALKKLISGSLNFGDNLISDSWKV